METVFEIIMDVLLDAATLFLVLHLIKIADCEKKSYRLVSGTFAVGFAFGVAAECIAKDSAAAVILYALGFMLAYTAFVFTFPEKRKHNEKR